MWFKKQLYFTGDNSIEEKAHFKICAQLKSNTRPLIIPTQCTSQVNTTEQMVLSEDWHISLKPGTTLMALRENQAVTCPGNPITWKYRESLNQTSVNIPQQYEQCYLPGFS